MSQNGKGSKSRITNYKVFCDNYENINWDDKSLDKSKQKIDNEDILRHDYFVDFMKMNESQ